MRRPLPGALAFGVGVVLGALLALAALHVRVRSFAAAVPELSWLAALDTVNGQDSASAAAFSSAPPESASSSPPWDAALFAAVNATASSRQCVHDADSQRRSCAFHNVCFDPAGGPRGEFIYYLPEGELPPHVFFDRRAAAAADRGAPTPEPMAAGVPTVVTRPLLFDGRHLSSAAPEDVWAPVLRRGHIPPDARRFPLPVVVHMSSFWPENFGHALGDDAMPVYQIARRFGLLRPDLLVLYRRGRSCGSFGHTDEERRRGCDNIARLFPLLTRTPVAVVGGEAPFAPAEGGRIVCVDRLLAGTGMLGMRFPHLPDEWDGLLAQVVQTAAPEHVGAAPAAQRVGILDKQGRRRLTNVPAAAEHLRQIFGVPVDVLTDLPRLPLAEQIATLRHYSVLVSPCGSLSFASAFMAPGASAVYVGFWDTDKGAPEQMEEYIWSQALAVRGFYYDTFANETTVRAPAFMSEAELQKVPVWEQYRNYGDVQIVLPRMARTVYDALYSAERAFGWTDSFSRAHLADL